MTPGYLDMEFPIFPPGVEPPGPPSLSPAQFIDWLEEARLMQSREAFEAWLAEPSSLPHGEPFTWRD